MATADLVDEIRRAHAAYYLDLVSRSEPEFETSNQVPYIRRLDGDVQNLLAAVHSSLEMGDDDTALGIVGGLRWFWSISGRVWDGRQITEEALSRCSRSRSLPRAKALLAAGELAWMHGDTNRAKTVLEESIRIWRDTDEKRYLSESLSFLGNTMERYEDPDVATRLYNEALDLREDIGINWATLHLYMSLGLRLMARKDYANANVNFELALNIAREVGDMWSTAYALDHLGDVDRCLGNFDQARHHYEESLALFREQGQYGAVPSILHNLGYVAHHDRDYSNALQYFRESMQRFQRQADRRGVAECLAGIAGVFAYSGDTDRAARLFGASEALLQAANTTLWPSNLPDYKRNVAALRSETEESRLMELWLEGRKLSYEQAVKIALESDASEVLQRVTRTFMFTDIVKSTNLAEAMGDTAWESLLRWHDQTLRGLFSAYKGEVVNTTGDGFFVAFQSAREAIDCGQAIQKRLAEHRAGSGFAPEIRIGIHQTEATLAGKDYHGVGVHEAARIGGVGGPGEIVVSKRTAEAAGITGLTSRSVTLKGISEPVDVVSIDWR